MAQWLRCCATNRKVAVSIPDGVIGIFHWHNPSNSASHRNEYQENFLGVNAAGAYGWRPYHLPVPLSWNLGTLTSWNPLGHSRPVTGLIYLYITSIEPCFVVIRHFNNLDTITILKTTNCCRWHKHILPRIHMTEIQSITRTGTMMTVQHFDSLCC